MSFIKYIVHPSKNFSINRVFHVSLQFIKKNCNSNIPRFLILRKSRRQLNYFNLKLFLSLSILYINTFFHSICKKILDPNILRKINYSSYPKRIKKKTPIYFILKLFTILIYKKNYPRILISHIKHTSQKTNFNNNIP